MDINEQRNLAKTERENNQSSSKRSAGKGKSAATFLKIQKELCDTIPGREGTSNNNTKISRFLFNIIKILGAAGERKVYVLPYTSITKLYNEYLHYCHVRRLQEDEIAQIRSFEKAWKKHQNDKNETFLLKLSGCKGSFTTCEICNNCTEFLKYNKKINGT